MSSTCTLSKEENKLRDGSVHVNSLLYLSMEMLYMSSKFKLASFLLFFFAIFLKDVNRTKKNN